MRIGCHASALQPARKAPYDAAIENAAALGFDGVELIAMDPAELTDYYSRDRIRQLRKSASASRLTISQFALFSTACEGIASLDAERKARDLDLMQRAVDVCAELGCDILNLVSHWPVGMAAPIEYIPSYIYPIARGLGRTPSPKYRMTLPADFDYAAIWSNYIDSLRQVAEMSAARGVRFAVEGHANVIVSGADALLRLYDQCDHPNLVVNFDTSWHFIQREYLPMSIHKLGRRIAHVHLRDADGLLFYGAPVGQGIIDWPGVIEALRAVAYDGFLSFEWGGFDDYLGVARDAREYIARLLR